MSTGFRIPAFPLTANIWHAPASPPAPPSDTTPCQLRGPSIHSAGVAFITLAFATVGANLPTLLMPALTDIRDRFTGSNEDIVEVPAGSGRLYTAILVEDIAKGFLNEHRMACLLKAGTWPTPIP